MSGPKRYWEDFELGRVYPIGSTSFTEERIVSFGRDFDPQPFHVDKAAAEASMFGGLIASGWHTCAAVMRLLVDNFSHPDTSVGGAGVQNVRWLRPVRPGDTLTASVKLVEKRESSSRRDIGLIFKEFEVVNQSGELVMTMQGREFIRRRPAAD